MISKIQAKVMEHFPQMKQKGLILKYYVALDFPQKQRPLISWWSSTIKCAIVQSKNVYISPSQLEQIFTVQGLKPLPLYQVLKLLSKAETYQWRDRKQIIDASQQGVSFVRLILRALIPQRQIRSKLSYYKSLHHQNQSKIINRQYLKEQLDLVKSIVLRQLNDNRFIPYQRVMISLNKELSIGPTSLQFILRQLENKLWISIQNTGKNKIIIFSQEINQIKNSKWINLQVQIHSLQTQIKIFENKLQKAEAQMQNKLMQAKQCMQKKNKQKARKYLVQVKKLTQTRDNLQLRVNAISSCLEKVQTNQANQQMIDLMYKSNKVMQQNKIDPSSFDKLIETQQQFKQRNQQINRRFQQLNSITKDNEMEQKIDEMLLQLNTQVAKEKAAKEKKSLKSKDLDGSIRNQQDFKWKISML